MVLPDVDDDCCDFTNPKCCSNCFWKTTKVIDLTAKPPFETYEDYYPEYKRCCPGTCFVLFVILMTIVHAGLVILLFYQAENVTTVFYEQGIPKNNRFRADPSLGVQVFPNVNAFMSTVDFNSTAFFTNLAWQTKVKAQWARCIIRDGQAVECTDLGWKIGDNGIQPSLTNDLTVFNQMYAPSYATIVFIMGHCNTTQIPLAGTNITGDYTLPCNTTAADVQLELEGAILQIRQKNYLPSNIKDSFLKNSYSQFRDIMDTISLQMIDYFFTPFLIQPLSVAYIFSRKTIQGNGGYAATLSTRSTHVARATNQIIFGSGSNNSGIVLSTNELYGFYQFGMQNVMLDYTVNEKTVFTLLADFGAWFFLIYVCSLIVKTVTTRCFWSSQKTPLKRDKDKEQFLQAVTNKEPAEMEDELLYALTFGGTKKFGWQTKHIFEYYQSCNNDIDYLRKIQKPLERFRANRRIEDGIKAQVKNQAAVNQDRIYDSLDVSARQNLLKEDDEEVRKEVFVSIALYHITTEITKLREIIASELNGEAKHYELEKKLAALE
mmetsp:Transcript_10801/g.19712  ORF Transcript_10801/g.19712 Transcript_10801/m.19712 type:complete len:548 (-) Transcript_10801:262-1905(-)|eukprot:CAMPEP_0197536604 /NCGR_PEP_ID=MMETSP1318-20131121/54336_1 /TAXON_ID=552666 /ORGANISM="Partenskyella glossopodia, Strain RCC365" /LENGTH=547 /DNA_ID=CAMNT_0043094537 /DNA_START=106 /DNA_END=1749 /DNA_ORIENTATION=+